MVAFPVLDSLRDHGCVRIYLEATIKRKTAWRARLMILASLVFVWAYAGSPEEGSRKISRENQSAVIVVTHDVRMIEGFDHVYRMKDGHLEPSQS